MQKQKTNDLHRPRIGIDLLGCETPGEKLLEALIKHEFKGAHPPKFTLFATQEIFDYCPIPEDFQCCVVTESIEMGDAPLAALRQKKDSSIAAGISQLQSYDLDAFISAGNTGALFASAKLNLNTLPGIDRPALIALIPTKLDPVAVIDVGANVRVKTENYLQFALMGIAYQKSRGVENPTVGLLNIGEEEQKGTPEVRKAHELLLSLNEDAPIGHPVFLGNVEGRDVFHGNIDVLITDGFTGNVFLKTAEGIAGFVLDQMQNLGPIESLPGIKSIIGGLRQRLHYAEYPGAILCGIDGIVMKCHGASGPEAFINSIQSSSHLVKNFFLEKVKEELTQ